MILENDFIQMVFVEWCNVFDVQHVRQRLISGEPTVVPAVPFIFDALSQAAAKQRAGRCGRVAEGVCIRLYSEEDYARRPAFTDPELLRSSLALVTPEDAALPGVIRATSRASTPS